MKRIFKLLFLLIISGSAFGQQKDVVNVERFKTKIKKERGIVLDVRTPEEYAQGHLRKAINIDWKNLEEFKAKAVQLDKQKPIYVYCRTGVRSEKASEWLHKNGFTHVIGLEGGMEAWKKADQRVTKK